MLDHKSCSIRQIFRLFQRVEYFLIAHNLADEAFMSTSNRQAIIEEIHDIYLSYLYDEDIKVKILGELISEVFNSNNGLEESGAGNLDTAGTVSYITDHTR